MLRSTPFVILDDARPRSGGQRLFSVPERVIIAHDAAEIPAALRALDHGVKSGRHAAGYFSYELGYFLEPKLERIAPQVRRVPLLWFGLFNGFEQIHPHNFDSWLGGHIASRAYAGPARFSEDEDSYSRKFDAVQEYIRAGDVYQINLTFPARFSFCGDPLALYARLRPHAAAGQGAFVFDGERSILSFSPELFFSVQNGVVTARPMKGTAPRGADTMSDEASKARLMESRKDRAENLMIVDLIRNDFGRLAKTGAVRTRDLFAVESYPTVHQMVSTIDAELRPGIGIEDLIRAVFPCGSVTGAPKIRAMEVIRELESEPRGVYCGSIGVFSPDGSASLNVAIRTLTISGDEGTLGVGSAVVADSTARDEFQECLLKARYFEEGRVPLSLIETLRFDPAQGFVRGERHLTRMRESAGCLGIAFDEVAARAAMNRAVAGISEVRRIRLLLAEDGSLDVESRAFDAPGEGDVWRYVISEHRVQSGDRLARYKSSWREIYDSERAQWNALGADEVLYLNEKDELAEGSITNVFVRLDGDLYTPPLSAGALDGCLRRSLIAEGTCTERGLIRADLERAEGVYFGNSLRGLIRAEAHKT